jgi:hypothetical protein
MPRGGSSTSLLYEVLICDVRQYGNALVANERWREEERPRRRWPKSGHVVLCQVGERIALISESESSDVMKCVGRVSAPIQCSRDCA